MKRLLSLADSYFSPAFQSVLQQEVPSEHYVTQDAYLSNYELPGVAKEQLQIEIQNDHLKVAITSAAPVSTNAEEQNAENTSRKSACIISQKLPQRIHRDAIQAKLENGILSLRYPKLEEPSPQRIEIQ